jgi:uncharacterized protein
MAGKGIVARSEAEEDEVSARTCIATRAVRPPEEMLRFVRAPDGRVVPDIRRKLPGRGVWVTATAAAVAEAMRRKAFGRALKAEVLVADELVDQVDALLCDATLQSLAMANKAGRVIAGFGKVESALRGNGVRAVLHAAEAAADGRRKLGLAAGGKATPIELFTGEQLSLALGRPHVIHAALLPGPVSAALIDRCDALARYRGSPPVSATATDMGDDDGTSTAEAEGMDAE